MNSKKIEINMNEEIKKDFLKDFEFYYNHYVTLNNFLGKLRKMNIKIRLRQENFWLNRRNKRR